MCGKTLYINDEHDISMPILSINSACPLGSKKGLYAYLVASSRIAENIVVY